MRTRLDDELILRYVSGRATAAEKDKVKKAVDESSDCLVQLQATEYLRDEFESVWETLSAANFGALHRKIDASKPGSNSDVDKGITTRQPHSKPDITSKPQKIRLAAIRERNSNVVCTEGKEWLIPLLECVQLGLVEGSAVISLKEDAFETERRGIAAEDTQQPQRFGAWSIPLGESHGHLKIVAQNQDKPDNWEITCKLSGCSDAHFSEKARLHVLTEKGKARAQMALKCADAIPLKSGKWRFEISDAETTHAIEISLCSPS